MKTGRFADLVRLAVAAVMAGSSLVAVGITIGATRAAAAPGTPVGLQDESQFVFASQVGAAADPVAVQYTNTTSSTLTGLTAAISGPNAADWKIANPHCPSSLPALTSCTIPLVFVAGGVGARSATLTVTSSSPNSPESTTLQGRGRPLPGAAIAVYQTNRFHAAGELALVRLPSLVSTLLDAGPGDDFPRVAPNGQTVVFQSSRTGSNRLYEINADGTGLMPIATSVPAGCSEGYPAISMNGAEIAFNLTCGASTSLGIMNFDGSNVRNLAIPVGYGNPQDPSWSPDGTQLAFVAAAPATPGGADIFKVTLTADHTAIVGSPVQLTTNGAGFSTANFNPAWSPDGTRIAYQGNGIDGSFPLDSHVMVMGADGSGQTRLTPPDGENRADPAWESDSQHLHYDIQDTPSTSYIATHDLNPASTELGSPSGSADRAVFLSTKSFVLTADQPVTTVSPTSVGLNHLTLAPDSPSAGHDPEGLPAGDVNLLGLSGPLANVNLLGLPLLSNVNLLGLSGPLANVNLLGLPLLVNVNLLGLSGPLANINLLGLPLLVNVNLLGLPAGWTSLINLPGSPFAGEPLNSVTLFQLFEAAKAAPATQFGQTVAKITLGDIDWTQSLLATTALGALLLGPTTFNQMPPPADGWCALFNSVLQKSDCGTTEFGGTRGTAFGYQAAGFDISRLPLNGAPLGEFQLPDGGTPDTTAPLLGVRLADIQTSVGLDRTPEGSIEVSEIPVPSAVVDCNRVDCGGTSTVTLAAAGVAGHLNPAGTIGDLGRVSGGVFTPGARLGGFSLGEVAFSLLPAPQTPIENLDLNTLHLDAYGGSGASTVRMHLTDTSLAPAGPATAQVTLPPGAVYVPGSTVLSIDAAQTTGGRGGPTNLGDPVIAGNKLTWQLPVPPFVSGLTFEIDFSVHPGEAAGTAVAHASVTGPGWAVDSTDALNEPTLTIGGALEPAQDSVTTAPSLTPDRAYLLTTPATGTGYFNVPVPTDSSGKPIAGARLRVTMSHLTNDNDLVVYGLPGSIASTPYRPAPHLLTIGGSPVVAAGSGRPPVPDTTVGLTTPNPATPGQTVNDVPLRPDLPLAGISATSGLSDEQVEVVVPDDATALGHFTVQVSAYNGSSSPQPYVLRYSVIGVPNLPPCAARNLTGSVSWPPGFTPPSSPPTVAAATQNLFIVSPSRMANAYGATATAKMLTDLVSLVARSDVGGQIINLDDNINPAFTTVHASFVTADANQCSVSAANGVVRAVNGVVDSLTPIGPSYGLRSVTLVGADPIIPQGRVADLTAQFNERDYTNALQFTEAGQGGTPASNALLQSAALGYVLTDAPYGDLAPAIYPGGAVDVPQLAVGRLVETPTEIDDAITRYVAAGGVLSATSSLSAGYASSGTGDSATAVSERGFAANGLTTDRKVLTDPPAWSATDLVNGLTTAAGTARGLINLAGHFDHHEMEPDSNSAGVFATTPATGAHSLRELPALAGSGILSMSCHSGLNVPDVLLTNPTVAQQAQLTDWPQALTDHGAAFEVGSSGFGYADRYAIGYGQQILTGIATNLKQGTTIGDAVKDATSSYFAGLAVVGPYDAKVLAETTLYGLPMYRLAGTPVPPPPPSPRPLSGPTSALPQWATVTVNPNLIAHNAGDGTGYFTDGIQAPQLTQNEPIIPKTSTDVTEPGLIATGALITALTVSPLSQSGFTASISRPLMDSTAAEPPLASGQMIFPAALQNIGSVTTSQGFRQTLDLLDGQFQATGTAGGHTVGTMSLLSSLQAQVFYGDPTAASDSVPAFSSVTSDATGNTLNITAGVMPDATSAVPVTEVLVLYVDASGWHSFSLTQSLSNPATWSGSSTQLVGGIGPVRYFVQAVKKSGRVGIATNKAYLYPADPTPPTVTFSSPVDGALYGVGHHVLASYSCTDGPAPHGPAPVCGGAVPSGQMIDTTSPGPHTFSITATGSNGVSTVVKHSYTVVLPQVQLTAPADGGVYIVHQPAKASYTCTDASAPTGLAATCSGSIATGAALDTSRPGLKTFSVTATNADGASVTVTHTYAVVYRFVGYTTTVQNPPAMNTAASGAPITLDFTLKDYYGATFTGLASTNVGYVFQHISCGAGFVAPTTTPPTFVSSPINVPLFGNVSIIVGTPTTFSGTCQQGRLTLFSDPKDVHPANFKF